MYRIFSFVAPLLFLMLGCEGPEKTPAGLMVMDANLQLDLIASEPEIQTPIGLAIDEQDAIYVLESHTHTPMSDYGGPEFDRIKKGVDENGDGKPERWLIFADSLEDGMNLTYAREQGLYLATKNRILRFWDTDGDGISDERQTVLLMKKPADVYDHAGILGVAAGPGGWLYVSRGNTGGKHWQITGTDGGMVEGYGDGGNVVRCRMNGSRLEEVATGFWNPFDIKFTGEGRLMLTDNDPDSRGPNRLIEVVPGGDYGYQSMYGGSGIHPFLSWNGELPGTLPYAAPLGEAPCALIDAGFTNFGEKYLDQMLVNVWEENNIVQITLKPKGSSIWGVPEVLLQGDSLFHPVALATNSKGDLYITDWVIRQYPNHGRGKIWRLSGGEGRSNYETFKEQRSSIDRFGDPQWSIQEIGEVLKTGDEFRKAMARRYLAENAEREVLAGLIMSEDPSLRLQALLVFLTREDRLARMTLMQLLKDQDERIKRMTLVYIGRKLRQDMSVDLDRVFTSGTIGPALFETYLAAIRHLQPSFIQSYQQKSESNSKKLPRELPEGFIAGILENQGIDEATRAVALPYLQNLESNKQMLMELLKVAKEETFQMALLKSLRLFSDKEMATELLRIAENMDYSEGVRAQALLHLSLQPGDNCEAVQSLLGAGERALDYASVKYLCRCAGKEEVRQVVDQWLVQEDQKASSKLQAVWKQCQGNLTHVPKTDEEWMASINGEGYAEIGRLVFESLQNQCLTCHQVAGWGGVFGPDLSHIGSSKSRRQLINAILDPSLEIAPEWQGWYVIDQEGRTHYGRQIDVHLNHVELMNAGGTFDRYDTPRSFGASEESLMPEGLERQITGPEFNDLIAYLTSLK